MFSRLCFDQHPERGRSLLSQLTAPPPDLTGCRRKHEWPNDWRSDKRSVDKPISELGADRADPTTCRHRGCRFKVSPGLWIALVRFKHLVKNEWAYHLTRNTRTRPGEALLLRIKANQGPNLSSSSSGSNGSPNQAMLSTEIRNETPFHRPGLKKD